MYNPTTQGALNLKNVIWLLITMALVIAPHAMRLPVWITAACVAAGLARWHIARRGLRAPNSWVMGIMALLIAGGTWFQFRAFFGREVGVALLVVMLCLKILEMRVKRDALLVIFLGFFMVMTNFLYSQTIFIGVYMFTCVLFFVATLIGFNRVNTEATTRERLKPAAWLLVQAVPLMLVMFFLFPRISGPLWRMPSQGQATTGLSDKMSPGDIDKLMKSDELAFRVDFDGPAPQPFELYFRGPVLSLFDGTTWSLMASANNNTQDVVMTPISPAISYRVTQPPSSHQYLFALDLLGSLPPESEISSEYQLRSIAPPNALRSYSMKSHLQYRAGNNLSTPMRKRYLALGFGNPLTIEWGRSLRKKHGADNVALVEEVLEKYRAEFEYTLEPPKLANSPMDGFLFQSKKGFCEHYSGSFALLMRAADIPARVVTGYQGGEINSINQQLVVKQSDAHAWTEIWLDDRGWVRVDPTSAVSPLRVNQGVNAALGPLNTFESMMAADKLGLLKAIQQNWDAVNNKWTQWVIGFNADRQQSLFSWAGLQSVDWQTIGLLMLAGFILVGAIISAPLMWRLYRVKTDPAAAAFKRFTAKLNRVGLKHEAWEGPQDLLARLNDPRYALSTASQTAARAVLEHYISLRYGIESTQTGAQKRATVAQLRRMISGFRPRSK
jgi:protein-glutamine gamma-glutamyltransferase